MNRLAQSSRLLAAATVVAKRAGDSQNMSGQNLSATTENGVAVEVVERMRRNFSISQDRLAREAGFNERTYRRALADPQRASPALIGRLADALRRIRSSQHHDDTRTTAAIETFYGGFLIAIAPRLGVTPAQVRASDPRAASTADPHWRRCSHARQAAIYLTNTTMGVSQRAIARTVGLTEAAVCLACKAVEERRTDPDFDRLLDQAAFDVTGRWTV